MAGTAEQRQARDAEERVVGTALLFLRARVMLDEMVERGGDIAGIPFVELDSFVENELFDLKEECHWLFRSQGRADAMGASSAMLFDILVGSLFHQLMKTKENSYQVERYKPKYEALSNSFAQRPVPEQVQALLTEGERIIVRARNALHEEFVYAMELFDDAASVLRYVLVEHRDSALLARALIDNEALLDSVYDAGSLDGLLRQMYGRPAAGLVAAATSLLDGGWYDRARDLCKRARKLDPRNKSVAKLLNQINAAAHAHLS